MFKKITKWFKSLFSKVDALKDKYLPVAVSVVQAVKKAIESGTFDIAADIVKTIIPGTADDILIDKAIKIARKAIPQICIQLEILNASNLLHGDEIAVKQALAALQDTYGEKWEKFMSGLAGEIVSMLADGKIDAKEAMQLAKLYYETHVKPVE